MTTEPTAPDQVAFTSLNREETQAHVLATLNKNKAALTAEFIEGLEKVVVSLAEKVDVTELPRVDVQFNVSVDGTDENQKVNVSYTPYLVFTHTYDIMEQAKQAILQGLFVNIITEQKEQAQTFIKADPQEDAPTTD